MRVSWLTAAQRLAAPLLLVGGALALLASSSVVEAQAGRRLARARSNPGLGRALTRPERRPPSRSSAPGWALDLSAQTSLPLSVGVEAQLQTPVGITFQLAGGHTPHAYLDAVASALGDAGVYRERIRPVIDDAIASGGWNLRLGIGYTAFDGLELGFGYTLLTTSTGLAPESVETALNRRIPWPDGMEAIPLSVTIHALHGRIGWRFLIAEHLVVRVALGWTHTVAAEVALDVPDELREGDDDPVAQIERSMNDGMQEWGFSPELVLSAGYRF